ncbi:hypothetical protein [Micrococcus luteus]|uniref:hypothetical protein n=1 Tax=Micrococcus luteus TaxID=1270 RepID=UPI0019D1D139|nr:hypothetical protein [Micrococcus luteus]MBN6749912.1 hypothetical protein [Micrococcus luteus]MBN6759893.1 hypothetical protein [Micrococcus luteus]MBN6801411.1 hypothetical protein [Micrococcus luteus]
MSHRAPEPIGAAPVRPVQLQRLDLARRALATRYGVPVSRIRGRTVPDLERSARALAAEHHPHDDGPAAA